MGCCFPGLFSFFRRKGAGRKKKAAYTASEDSVAHSTVPSFTETIAVGSSIVGEAATAAEEGSCCLSGAGGTGTCLFHNKQYVLIDEP